MLEELQALAQRLSALMGGLNGFFAGIAVALFMMWSNQPAGTKPLGAPVQPAAAPPGGAEGAGKDEPEGEGDLDEVGGRKSESILPTREIDGCRSQLPRQLDRLPPPPGTLFTSVDP